ncbi:hypothetical protein [Alteromonas lipolytica]|uniref:Lipoprotein n=1 Tax=Alteromonas lipolytica TaxID=1856405 RepID=A0A1E8FB67_9ALTE|nr:hypothetical protein [Alteromonas lipolytica]OFI33026.1 hypothetical protein BFC17_01765 [Alteromonas lipolytica]GGF63177.1 hypothetical protein GCM10011338_14530 [Alteromonas lipolytica]
MKNALWLATGFVVVFLSGCEATEPEPYQADRAPEERTEYNGWKGLVQQQKDQNYLMSAELRRKCDAARVDLAVAESTGDAQNAKIQRDIINNTCV